MGLELLLGGDQNQSLSHQLRRRAAALALLHADPAHPAAEAASNIKKLFEARSIVHGRRKQRTTKPSEVMNSLQPLVPAISYDRAWESFLALAG